MLVTSVFGVATTIAPIAVVFDRFVRKMGLATAR
jgi:hypothetical protein